MRASVILTGIDDRGQVLVQRKYMRYDVENIPNEIKFLKRAFSRNIVRVVVDLAI